MQSYTILAVFLLGLFLTNNAFAVVEISTGVLGLYHLNGDEVDSSGNGLNYTNSNATFASGKLNDGVVIDPASDYLNNSTVTDFQTPQSSLSFWIKSDQSDNVCVISQAAAGQYKYNVSVNAGVLEVTQYTSNAGSARTVSGGSISNGTWYLINTDMNTDIARLWINNEFIDSDTTALSWHYQSTAAQRIGTRVDGCSQFKGMIDELVITDFNIGTTTRTALYNDGAGDEVCVTEGCGGSGSSTPSSTASSTAMTDYETFLTYQYVLSLLGLTSFGTYYFLKPR